MSQNLSKQIGAIGVDNSYDSESQISPLEFVIPLLNLPLHAGEKQGKTYHYYNRQYNRRFFH